MLTNLFAELLMIVDLPPNYKPNENEPYMNVMQLEYFRRKLLSWKADLLKDSSSTLQHLQEENWHEADPNDRATLEHDTSIELRTRDRYRKLIEKIDEAIGRVETGEYGYCQETGDEIGIGRLEARPVATLSIDAQERHEKFEKAYSDDELDDQ